MPAPGIGLLGGLVQAVVATVRAIEKEKTNQDFVEVVESGIAEMVDQLDRDTHGQQQQAHWQEVQKLKQKLGKIRSKKGWKHKLNNYLSASKRKDDLLVNSQHLASLERRQMNQRLQQIDTTINQLQEALVAFIQNTTTNSQEQQEVTEQVTATLTHLSTSLHTEAQAVSRLEPISESTAHYDQAPSLLQQQACTVPTATRRTATLHHATYPNASTSTAAHYQPLHAAPVATTSAPSTSRDQFLLPSPTFNRPPASASTPRSLNSPQPSPADPQPPLDVLHDSVMTTPSSPAAPAATTTDETMFSELLSMWRDDDGPGAPTFTQHSPPGPPATPPAAATPASHPINNLELSQVDSVPPFDIIATTSFSLSESDSGSDSATGTHSEQCPTEWSDNSPSASHGAAHATRSPFVTSLTPPGSVASAAPCDPTPSDARRTQGDPSGQPPHPTRNLTGEPPHHARNLTGEPTHHARSLTGEPPHHARSLTGEPTDHARSLTGEPTDHARSLTGEPTDHARSLTGEPTHHARSLTGEPTHHARNLTGEPAHHARSLTGEPAHHARSLTGEPPHYPHHTGHPSTHQPHSARSAHSISHPSHPHPHFSHCHSSGSSNSSSSDHWRDSSPPRAIPSSVPHPTPPHPASTQQCPPPAAPTTSARPQTAPTVRRHTPTASSPSQTLPADHQPHRSSASLPVMSAARTPYRPHAPPATTVLARSTAPTPSAPVPPPAGLLHSLSEAQAGRMEGGSRQALDAMRAVLEAATHPAYFEAAFGANVMYLSYADLRRHLLVAYGCDIGPDGDEGYCRLFPSFYNAATRGIGRAGFPAFTSGLVQLHAIFAEALTRTPAGQLTTGGPAESAHALLRRDVALALVHKTLKRFTSIQTLLFRYQGRQGNNRLHDLVAATAERQAITSRDMVAFPGFVRLVLAVVACI